MGLERTGLHLVLEGQRTFVSGVQAAQRATDRLDASFKKLADKTRLSNLRDLKIGDVVPQGALDRLKGYTDQLDRVGMAIGRLSPQVGGAIHLVTGLTGEIGKMGAAMSLTTAGAIALGAALIGLGLRGQAMTGVVQAFDALSQSMGMMSNVFLEDLRAAARGTVADLTLMRQANLALAGAGPQLARALGKEGGLAGLLEIARVQARATGQDIDYLFNSLVVGIKRGSPLLIDNTGLVLAEAKANEAFARALGKSVDQLSAEEKQIALLNATLEAGQRSLDLYGNAALQASEYIARISTTITNTLDRLALAVQPIFTLLLNVADTILTAIIWPIQNIVIPIFYELANTIFGPLMTAFDLFKETLGTTIAPVLNLVHRWVVLVVGILRTLGRAFQWIARQAAKLFAPIADIVRKYIVEPFVKYLDPAKFAERAGNVFGAFAYGILWAANTLIYPAVIAIAEFIADFLMGFSPAKKGPLSKIDVGAANLMRSWLEGFTGVSLAPVSHMMGRVNTLLGDIAMLTHDEVTALLERLDAELQPFLDNLELAKAFAQSVLDPLQRAEDALKKRLDAAVQRFTQGGLDADAVRALDRQNEALARQKELWEGVTAEAEYQLALKQSEQAVLRAMLAIQQARTKPDQAIAGSAEKVAKAAKEAASKTGGGEAPEPTAAGGGGGGFADLESAVGEFLGVTDEEIDKLFGEMGAAFTEGFMIPGLDKQMTKFTVNNMKLQTQLKRIGQTDAFKGLKDTFNSVFGDGEDSLKSKVETFVDGVTEKFETAFSGADTEGSILWHVNNFKDKVSAVFTEDLPGIFDGFSLSAITEKFREIFGVDTSGIRSILNGFRTKIRLNFDVGGIITSLFDNFSLDNLFNTFERILGLEEGSIQSTLDSFKDKVSGIFKNEPGGALHDVIATVGDYLTKFIKDPAVTVANWFIEAFEKMVNAVISGINWLMKQWNSFPFGKGVEFTELGEVHFGRVGEKTLGGPSTPTPGATGGLFGRGLMKVHGGEVLMQQGADRMAVFPKKWVNAMDRLASAMVPYRAGSAPAPVVNVQSAGGGVTNHNTFNVQSQQSMRLAIARSRAFGG